MKVAVLDGSGAAEVPWWTNPITLSLGTNPGGGTLSGVTSAAPAAGGASFAAPDRQERRPATR